MNNKTISILQEGETLCDLAGELVQKGDYDLALKHYKNAEDLFKSVQDTTWIVFAQHEKFICLQNLEKFEDACAVSEEIISNYQFLDKQENLSLFLILLANVYVAIDDKAKSLEILRMAEYIVESQQLKHLYAHTYSNIAANLINLLQYNEALEYLTKAIEEYQSQKQEYGIAWCYEYMGRCFEELLIIDEAEKNYFKAQRRYLALNEPISALNSLKALVHLYSLTGKKEKAHQMQKLILQIEN